MGGKVSIVAAPRFVGERPVVPIRTGLVCLDPKTGAIGWQYTLPEGSRLDENARLWAQGDRLYLAAGQALVCLDAGSGTAIWTVPAGGWVRELSREGDYLVLIGETEGRVEDQLGKGPLQSPSVEIFKKVVAKEMPQLIGAELTPFTLVIKADGSAVACALDEIAGCATVRDDLLVVARTRVGFSFATSGEGFASAASVTGYKMDGAGLKWQESYKGSFSGGLFIGERFFCVYAMPGKKSDETIVKLVAIRIE
jgi:hypothetical protein